MKVDLVANSNSLKRRLLNCGGEKMLLVEEQMMQWLPPLERRPALRPQAVRSLGSCPDNAEKAQ
jgi:hypothetical protein